MKPVYFLLTRKPTKMPLSYLNIIKFTGLQDLQVFVYNTCDPFYFRRVYYFFYL